MTFHVKSIPDGAIYLMTHYVDQEANILNNKLSISVTKYYTNSKRHGI